MKENRSFLQMNFKYAIAVGLNRLNYRYNFTYSHAFVIYHLIKVPQVEQAIYLFIIQRPFPLKVSTPYSA